MIPLVLLYISSCASELISHTHRRLKGTDSAEPIPHEEYQDDHKTHTDRTEMPTLLDGETVPSSSAMYSE